MDRDNKAPLEDQLRKQMSEMGHSEAAEKPAAKKVSFFVERTGDSSIATRQRRRNRVAWTSIYRWPILRSWCIEQDPKAYTWATVTSFAHWCDRRGVTVVLGAGDITLYNKTTGIYVLIDQEHSIKDLDLLAEAVGLTATEREQTAIQAEMKDLGIDYQ
jgi:hypothetical protein